MKSIALQDAVAMIRDGANIMIGGLWLWAPRSA
jgi:acyl CoA:acetate/3-ketoacid CoA transferase alpha subunit